MTIAQTGYVDWVRQSPAAVASFFANTFGPTALVQTQGPFSVAGYDFVGLNAQSSSGVWQVDFRFWADAAGTQLQGQYVLDIANGGAANFSIPVRGSFMSVVMTPFAAGSTITAKVYSVPTAGRDSPLQSQANVLLSVDGVAVGAGATRTDDILTTWPGVGSFSAFFESGASWRVRLLSVNNGGTTRLLDYTSQAIPTTAHQVILPPTPLRLVSFNNDGVARNLYASVCGMPFPGP